MSSVSICIGYIINHSTYFSEYGFFVKEVECINRQKPIPLKLQFLSLKILDVNTSDSGKVAI